MVNEKPGENHKVKNAEFNGVSHELEERLNPQILASSDVFQIILKRGYKFENSTYNLKCNFLACPLLLILYFELEFTYKIKAFHELFF